MNVPPLFLIAELGSNPACYGWSARAFLAFCRSARLAGADAVKIQLWRTEHFPQVEWKSKRLLEFPRAQLHQFVATARQWNLRAGASVFDADAVALAREHNLDFLKLAAREQDNVLLYAACYATDLPVYYSVSDEAHCPIRKQQPNQFVPLFTIPRYPTHLGDALVQVMRARVWMRGAARWGWSSHTTHWLDGWLARKMGASVIEKHLRFGADEPEAAHSLNGAEFRRLAKHLGQVTYDW